MHLRCNVPGAGFRVTRVAMKPQKRVRPALGIICLVLLSGAVFALYPQYLLHIEDASSRETILEVPAQPGDNLWIVFVNSVERLPVADHFVVGDGHQLIFSETIYQAPYAGYLHPEKQERIAPGTIRIAGFDRPMEAVTFYAGYDSRHLLFVNGKWIPLYKVAKGGDLIRISITRRPRWATLSNRIFRK